MTSPLIGLSITCAINGGPERVYLITGVYMQSCPDDAIAFLVLRDPTDADLQWLVRMTDVVWECVADAIGEAMTASQWRHSASRIGGAT